VSASTGINADKLAEFFVKKGEGLRPAAAIIMFAMMHLHNFCQVSNEEVRQVMTRSPFKVPLSTETANGVG